MTAKAYTYSVVVTAKVGGAEVRKVDCGSSKSYAETVKESFESIFKSDKYKVEIKSQPKVS